MILTINDNVLINDLKEHFSKCYPGLKIEFYKNSHSDKQASSSKDLVSTNASVGSIRRNARSGGYRIYSHFTVAKVESDMHRMYGLNVQVFRNENNAWIQTTKTDHFTLSQQMEMCTHAGKSIFPMTKQQLDEYDYL